MWWLAIGFWLQFTFMMLLCEKLQILQKLQLQEVGWAADLRERDAEYADNSSDSANSEWLLAVSN
jgi:hypothetical protein